MVSFSKKVRASSAKEQKHERRPKASSKQQCQALPSQGGWEGKEENRGETEREKRKRVRGGERESRKDRKLWRPASETTRATPRGEGTGLYSACVNSRSERRKEGTRIPRCEATHSRVKTCDSPTRRPLTANTSRRKVGSDRGRAKRQDRGPNAMV